MDLAPNVTFWQIVAGSASVAVIVTVTLFLRFMTGENDKNRLLFGNHLSEVVKSQGDVAAQLQRVADKLDFLFALKPQPRFVSVRAKRKRKA